MGPFSIRHLLICFVYLALSIWAPAFTVHPGYRQLEGSFLASCTEEAAYQGSNPLAQRAIAEGTLRRGTNLVSHSSSGRTSLVAQYPGGQSVAHPLPLSDYGDRLCQLVVLRLFQMEQALSHLLSQLRRRLAGLFPAKGGTASAPTITGAQCREANQVQRSTALVTTPSGLETAATTSTAAAPSDTEGKATEGPRFPARSSVQRPWGQGTQRGQGNRDRAEWTARDQALATPSASLADTSEEMRLIRALQDAQTQGLSLPSTITDILAKVQDVSGKNLGKPKPSCCS